jgi:hypothetical protein
MKQEGKGEDGKKEGERISERDLGGRREGSHVKRIFQLSKDFLCLFRVREEHHWEKEEE